MSGRSILFAGLLATAAVAAPTTRLQARDDSVRGANSSCFPFGDNAATLNSDLSAPSVSRQDWWCTYDQTYGFLGFSYPLEESDCSADSNSYDTINAQFAAMKERFGATMVRTYYPLCTEQSIWINLLKAGVNNNMAVIPQFLGYETDSDGQWQKSRDALLAVMADYPIAPYVFHSVEFGSEPIGDGVDGGSDQYVTDLKDFVGKMNGQYGVPVAMSEDWDRSQLSNDGQLTDLGNEIKDATQQVHAHIMPYYHVGSFSDSWGYIKDQVAFYKSQVGLPTFISETQWAWGTDVQGGSAPQSDDTPDNYAQYWYNYDDNCQFFKDNQVGWFIHDWEGEGDFDMKIGDDQYQIADYKPHVC